MTRQIETLRALASEALRVVAAHDATAPPWRETARWQFLCRGCGATVRLHGRRWCLHCCEVLP